jgi:hypothetical protein
MIMLLWARGHCAVLGRIARLRRGQLTPSVFKGTAWT